MKTDLQWIIFCLNFNLGSHPDADTVHHTNLVMQLCVALWGTLLEFQHETGSKDKKNLNILLRCESM